MHKNHCTTNITIMKTAENENTNFIKILQRLSKDMRKTRNLLLIILAGINIADLFVLINIRSSPCCLKKCSDICPRTLSVGRSEQLLEVTFLSFKHFFATPLLGENHRLFPGFRRGIFSHMMCLDQSRASETIFRIIAVTLLIRPYKIVQRLNQE